MSYAYRAYGLVLQLPFPSAILPAASPGAAPDVIVEYGRVNRNLAAPIATGDRWEAEPGTFLWRGGARAARFLVGAGRRVTIEPNPEAQEEKIGGHLLAAVLAAILSQRGLLVMHCDAAVTRSGAAIAIGGVSGAGKSTTLAGLLARGCRMLADDIVALDFSSGEVMALPGVPRFHLCADAAARLGHDINGLPRHPLREAKAAVSAGESAASKPVRLQALYLLRSAAGDELRIERLHGAAKFDAIQECIYGPLLLDEHRRIFPLLTAVANRVDVFQVERPAARWTADDLADRLLLKSEA